MKRISLIAIMLFFYQAGKSQCSVTATASSTTIRCGQSVSLSAFGQSSGTVVLNENFNTHGFGPGWSSTPGAVNFNNPCSPGGVDGTPHAWMDNNTTEPRTLTSSPYNLTSATAGVTICFDLLYASQGNAAPCEGPDEPDEGVYLRYSTNGGSTWVTIHYFDPNGGNDPQLTSWHNHCFVIPAAAITANTMFSWYQDVGSGADYDHWGIDNVEIYQNDLNAQLVWLHDGYSYGIGNPGGTDPTPVRPTTTTTYTAQLTTGSGTTCTQSVTVTVLPPNFSTTASASPTSICPGDCSNITATANEILSPASTPTFTNAEISPVTSGHASVNINVQGLNTTSLTNGSITSVVITGFTFSGSSFCSNFGGCPCGTGTVGFGQTCTLNPGSFTVTLTAPGGCTIILAPAGVAGGGYSNTTFVPVGGTALGGTFPNGGTWNPNQPFSNLNGCNPNGVWTLTFNAPGVGFGIGALMGWSISFNDPAIIGPVTYAWSPTTNMTNSTTLSPTVCPASTTTYTLTVANPTAGCPTGNRTVTVTVNPCTTCTPPTATINNPAAICAPGTINLTSAVSGAGSNIVTYYATNANATAGTNPLGSTTVSSSGTYYIRVQDPVTATCFSVQTITVVINPAVSVSVTPPSASICPGSSVSLTASGATTYSWANAAGLDVTNAATVNASPASTTTYTVTGTTGTCTGTNTVTVTISNTLAVSVTPASATICPGSSVSLTASGATTYSWTNAAGLDITSGASVNASPASTSTYTVTGTTGTCTATAAVIVTVSNTLAVSVSPVNPTICPGGSVALTASGATNYSWANATGLDVTSGAIVNASPGGTTTYTVTGTSGTCTATAAVTVTVAGSLSVSITPANPTICPGGSVALTASGASTYSWANAVGLDVTSGATVNASPAGTTTYTVTGTSGTCTATATATVTVSSSLSVLVTPTSSTICPGGSVALTASGASTYSWANAAGLDVTNGATVNASPAGTTTYTVTGTSGTCTATATATVTVSSSLSVLVTPASSTICAGGSVALTASGASTYSWANAAGLDITNGATVNASPAGTTTYTVTGTSGTCTATATATITVNSIPTILVNSSTICSGQTANLTASGGTTYVWSAGATSTGVNTADASPIVIGVTTYTVTGTTNSCSNTAVSSVTVNAVPTILVNSPTICAGQTANLLASGGTTYSWSAGATSTGANTADVTPIATGVLTYTVTGTTNSCSNTAVASVTVNAVPTITVNTATICSGQTANLIAAGGTTYSWSAGATSTGVTTADASPTVTGVNTYTVTGTTNSCSNTAVASVTVNAVPTITVNSPIICLGQTANLIAAGGTTYLWSAGPVSTGVASADIAPATIGISTYTVTGTTNNCSNTAVASVTVNAVPSVTVNSPTICLGQTANLIAGGAATYTWSAGAVSTGINTSDATPAANGISTYTVTGTTSNCSATAVSTVVVNALPTILVNSPTICAGQTANLSASGGTSYSWPSGTTPTAFNTADATPTVTTPYSLTGSDGFCSATTTFTVTVDPLPIITVTGTNTICLGSSTTLTAVGAANYLWSPNATLDNSSTATVIANPILTTVYTIIGTTGICNSSTTYTVTVDPMVVATAGRDTAICYNESTQLSASGGNTYLWSPSFGLTNSTISNPTATPTSTTSYTVTVSNSGSCGSTDVVTVTVNPTPTVSAGIDTVINNGENIMLQGVGQGSLTWSEDGYTLSCYNCSNPTASPTTGTTYYLTTLDVNGCVNYDTIFVEVTQEWALYIPNAFTPDGDVLNAYFYPKGYGIKELHMMIFDRWGEKIFETKKLGDGWDGTYKGTNTVVKQDVYSYVITAVPFSGGKVRRTGSVTVVR